MAYVSAALQGAGLGFMTDLVLIGLLWRLSWRRTGQRAATAILYRYVG